MKKVKLKQIAMLWIIYLMLPYSVFGQSTALMDSLLLTMKKQVGIEKVQTLNELAWKYRKIKPKKARKFALTAKEMSDSLSYNKGFITSLNRLASIAFNKKEIEKAEELYLKILKEEIAHKNDYGIGRAYNQLGLVYTEKGEFKKALDYTIKAKEKFKLLNKKNIVSITLNNIGDLYRRLGNYSKAMEYFLKSLKIKESNGNEDSLASTLQNIGIFQIDLKNYETALDYLKRSKELFIKTHNKYELAKVHKNIGVAYYKLSNYTLAEDFFNNSIRIKRKLKIEEKDSDLFNNLGVIFFKKELFKKALLNFNKAIKIKDHSNIYSNIGHVYFQKNNFTKAIYFYEKSLSKAKTIGHKLEKMNALNNLSNTYSKIKNYSLAITYNNHYLILRDSLEKDYKEAMNLKVSYQEKQKQIILLEKDKKITQINLEKKEIDNKRKTTLIYGLSLSLLLTILLFFAIIRGNKQKQLVKITKKNRQIEEQKVEELLKNQELKSMNAMMVGQEKERNRIGKDLHDSLGGKLSMVKNHFKSVEEEIIKLQNSSAKLYNKANKLLDEACAEVREISQNIVSGVLTTFGLTAALEDLKDTLEESKQLDVEFVSHGLNDRLPLELEIIIYRVVQELISNILKHAKASEITIQLLKGKNGLNVLVEDNGIGFEITKINLGMGLKNIESRIDGLNGEFKIDSTLKKGTTITIDIPLNKQEKK